MNQLALLAPQIEQAVAGAPAATSAAELAKRGKIDQTAQAFEATFLTSMIQTMFKGISSAPPFGGGPGEDIWRSFLAEAMAKDMAKRGGIGLSSAVAREMLKLQDLAEKHASTPA
ncbi:MAG: rod-binding protein [Caulobacteraceae bacterium]